MNEAGVRDASSATRDAAGCSRSCSALKSSPTPVTSTISPSTTHRSGSSVRNASTNSGKYRVMGRSLRLPISTSPPSRKTTDRNPSHFGSYDAPAGMSGTDRDSIGATGGITGNFIPPFWLVRPGWLVDLAAEASGGAAVFSRPVR